MIENGKYSGFDENIKSQLNESSKTLIGAPITTGLDTAYAINAPEINWAGYKLYDEDLTSTGHMLSYIETQLDSKATSSGEIWDEIKDNEYITSQINIYASYTSNKIAPDIVWVNPTDNDVNTYSSLPSSSSDAEGWYTSTDIIPGTNKYVWMSSIYIVKSLSNNIFGYRGPSSTPIYLPSESGINGNFKSTVFCRTNETPKAPINGAVYNTGVPTIPQVYKASNNEQITGVEWSDGIPSGQEILWASTGIIKDSSPETTVWTTPRQMTDTATYDVEFAKKQTNDATPATPNDSNRHGSDAQIWFDPTKDASQDFTQMYWRAERECINGERGDWVIVRIKGEQGTAGIKGDFKSTVFKRSENQPEAPSGGDYDHPVPSGWYDGIPNGTGPVWSTWKTFSANDNNSSWTTPALVADTPTYDVEFSPYSNNNNTSPRTTENIDTSNDWFDPTKDALPENITWENMIWRAERNRATSQDAWSTWVITKIKGEDGHVNLDMPYYEQRWRTFENTASVPSSWDNSNLPYKDNSYINVDDSNGWTLVPNYSSGGIVYMTSCKVIIDVIDNAQTKRYNGDWPTPIRVTGIDGKANPIQPVLKYQWYNTNEYSNVPSCSINSEDPGNSWLESPGNPSGENKYLWMIQGQRQDNSMQTIDGTNYWTSPVCLSGADGEPGVDGDDIEFVYHIYNTVQVFGDSNDNPSHWEVSSQDNYLGPDGYKWTNHPTGVTLLNKYEYCSYRRKTGITGNKQWTTFSAPFAWSIYGENGLDGDGVEYIYAVTATDTAPTQPKINSDNYTASQQSEWGVDNSTWFDDPQLVNNSSQKFQWVSTRKYRYPKSGETTLGDNTLDPNKKYWFNYSNPQLWNWYVNNGTNADKYVMIFTRTGSSETVPTSPNTNLTVWSESPGNNTSSTDDEFLWMSAQYIEYNKTYNTTTRKNWSTPVCLTGESGRDGEDGADIEFIYYRTADDNKTFGDGWDHFDGDSSENDWPFVGKVNIDYYITSDGIKTLLNQDNNTWTDNPLGVTSTYDYEYVSIRKKIDGTWQDFCKPFLWSKYGEDGVDGDGVEYIYYLSPDENAVTFDNISQSDNDNSNNPANWSTNQSSEHILNGWSDDPSGVSEEKRWEYVSVRHKRLNNTTGKVEWGKYSEPAVWSHFAVDALATSLVFETDNDMIAVSVDDNSHVTKNATSTARMYLYHDTKLVSTSYYNVNILDSNLDEHNGEIKGYYDDGNVSYSYLKYNDDIIAKVSLSNNTYVMEYNIPQGFDMSSVDDELRITTSAYIFDNSFDSTGHIEVGSERTFVNKVKGLHVDLSDIYQIQTDKNVVKKNPQNELENVTITLKSLTSNSRIDTTSDAVNEHLFVLYKDGININKNTLISYVVEIGTPITLNDKLSVHEFELWYNPSNTYWVNNKLSRPNNVSQVFNGENDILLDEESLSLVWDGTDGKPGTDSKSQEYIYYRSELPVSTWDNAHNPSVWSTHENVIVDRKSYYAYCTDDFPFIAERTSYNNWYDHPQGIDGESYLYEYVSTREYDTSTKEWGTFSEPVAWATWGHSGEDGDGVEYIYYLNDSATFNGDKPQTWYNDTNYQNSEYIKTNTNWTDNPSNVGPNNKYEWVSIRKYKKIKYNDDILHLLFDDLIFNSIYDEYIYFIENTDWDIQNPDITLLDYIYSICEYYVEGNSTIISNVFSNDYQSRWYDSRSGINLYEIIYNILNTYFNALELEIKYDQGAKSHTYFKLIEKENKFWSPYSQPSLWAKYGEKGATGDPGGSGLTFDFDNPSIQIAVNSNGRIKDYQEVTTYLNVYEGASKISAKDVTLSIISNGTHAAFEHSYSDTDKYGYTLFNSNNSNNGTSTYYTWKIGDVDIENIGDNNIVKLTGNSSIEFNINYNNKDYVKRVSLVPIQYGEDGANAFVFDLYCPTSVIHYNAMDDTPSFNPTTISDIKVRKIENGNVEYFVAANDNGFTIKYKIDFYLKDGEYNTPNETAEDEVINGTLNINTIINTVLSTTDKIFNIPKTVKLSLYHTEDGTASLWDETDLEIIYDGIDGVDGNSIEYIYYCPESTTQINWTFGDYAGWTSGDNDDSKINPSYWTPNGNNGAHDYIPLVNSWTDHPNGVDDSHVWEYVSTREYNGETQTWGRYTSPQPWSHYGYDGKDGDGIEYIYCACNYNNIDDLNAHCPVPVFNLNTSDTSEIKGFQKYEVYDGTIWHDDPQQVNNTNQKYQWVSIRKFKKITDTNKTEISSSFTGDSYTINDITVHVGDKIWFPYSRPELWNWYVNDGTDASRIVMVYQRNNSGTVAPTLPTKDDNNKTIITNILNGSQNGWCESPGSASNDHKYLWMTSAHYTNKESSQGSENSIIYTIEDSWQTAVCLTGEPGHEGEDGSDVEFIYYRTADDNIAFNDDWNNFGGDSSENGWPFNTSTGNVNEIDEIKYYDPNGDFDEAPSSDVLHDVWTDNPLGVTSTYDYEYAAVRRKPAGSNSAWEDFSKPFLWSKYGEDGVDGDGVEYIFYRTDGTTSAEFTAFVKNPKNWLHNEGYQTTSEYKRSKPTSETAWWNNDPLGVGKDNKYEYVSTRKKISKQNYFKLVKNWLNPLAKSSISKLENYNDWISIYNDGEYNSSDYSTWKIQLIDNDIASWTNENELNAIYNLLTNKQQKVWGSYSEPALWSNFAEDALATNLVLESDNDNITVSVTSEGTVNNNYTDSANFTLVYNTKPLNLGTDYTLKILTEPTPSSGNNYNPFGTKTDTTIPFNTDLFKGNFASLTENTLTVNIPEGFDISKYDYIMSITLEAKIIRNDIAGLEINTPVIFTLKISGVELSINDIYKLNIDRQVIKLNSNNTYDTINISLKSLTSNNSITSQQDAASKHLYIRYNVDERNNVDKDAHLIDINNECISVGQFNPSAYYNKHTFRLYYILDDSFLNNVLLSDTLTDTVLNEHNAVLLDTETITAVYDGAKGDTGDKGSDAVSLDWTNDQINLAVDENGLILPNQRKSTVLSTNNENILISAVNDNFSTKFTTSQQFHSNTQTISKPTKNYSFGIEIKNDYVKNSSNVIPENGIEVTFTVTLNNGNTITKDLRICGQHNGKNGENAVTYEILASANSATKNTTDVITPSAITLSALKYSGTDITTLTALPEYLKFTYVFCNETNMSDEFNVDNTYTFNLISAVYKNNGQELNPILQNGGTDKSADNSAALNNAVTNKTSITTEHTGAQTGTQTGAQTTGISSGIGTGGEYSPIQGTDYLFKVSYANVYLSYQYNAEWKHIDMETIPIIDQGEKGAQGFNGAIVRMRGEYVHSAAIQYGNGEYNRSTTGAQYNGVSPLYIDIVTYTNNNGTKYYTPKTGVTGSYMSNDSSYLCKGSQYVSNTYPTQPDGSINSKWKAATQFDFVATKLLYADQALINQISSHDFIATTEDGTPVAGMTSGKKDYGNNGKSLSLLNNANGGNIDTGGNDTDTLEDTSHVRMFAGQIWKNDGSSTSYSLTYAPFNVRQDGTAYMSKAHVEGDITANTLTLGDGSFKHLNLDNTLYTLPSVYDNSTRSFYILCDADNCTLTCESPMKLRVSVGESKKLIGNTILLLSKSTFYQCISIKENDTNYWNIIATKISEDTGTEYKYIDITDDVQLIGYKYLSDNGTNNVILSSIDTYDTEHPCGPLITNNTTNGTIDIEFFTYLDPTLYGDGTIDNVALADFGEFIWLNM